MNGEYSGREQLAQEQAKQDPSLSRNKKVGLATKAMSRKILETHVQSWMPTTRCKK